MPWTQCHRQLASVSVGLTFVLLVGCSDTSPPPFELVRVNPSTVLSSVETKAFVEGKQFYDSVKVRLNDNVPATIDHGWDVSVDAVRHLSRDQTSRIDATTLSILLPAGLSIGTHNLSVTDPRGQSRTLTNAFTVVADGNTTVLNASGGATSISSGGTTSRSDGGSGGNTLSSSGGTGITGGIASIAGSGNTLSSSGGTEAAGGITGTSGNANATSGGTDAVGGTDTAGSGAASTTSGGTDAVGGITGMAGSGAASTTSGGTGASPQCGNGKCEPTESVCNCPSDCQSPSCGDAGSPQLCDANDPSLVGCYRFESSTQPGKDDSRYGNNATSTNATLVAGYDGNSIKLGASSQMLVAKSPSLDVSHLTIETWIRLDAVPAGARAGLFDSNVQFGFFVQKSRVLRCTAAGGAAQTTALVSLLVWTHVACTYDGANIKIFVNGVEQASAPATGAISTSGTTGASIGSNNPTGDNLAGLIDDLRVWNVARTTDQICDAAHACIP